MKRLSVCVKAENLENRIPKVELAFRYTPLSFPRLWEKGWLVPCCEPSLFVIEPETFKRSIPYSLPSG